MPYEKNKNTYREVSSADFLVFFNTDKILIKTLFDKLKNSDKDADDILHKLIITKSIDEPDN